MPNSAESLTDPDSSMPFFRIIPTPDSTNYPDGHRYLSANTMGTEYAGDVWCFTIDLLQDDQNTVLNSTYAYEVAKSFGYNSSEGWDTNFGVWDTDEDHDHLKGLVNKQWFTKCFARSGTDGRYLHCVIPQPNQYGYWHLNDLPIGATRMEITVGSHLQTALEGQWMNNNFVANGPDDDYATGTPGSDCKACMGMFAFRDQWPDYVWTSYDVRKNMYPCNWYGQNGSYSKGPYYLFGGFKKTEFVENGTNSDCPWTKSLAEALGGQTAFTNAKIGKNNIMYYNSKNFNKHFEGNYSFKVDIPDLHTGGMAGKIKIIFGQGIPFSGYGNYGGKGTLIDTTYDITVQNVG